MDITLSIVMADPAGNRTALVETPADPALYAALGAAILADPALHAEQAGFITAGSGGIPRLQMCGGEFCGNASRSFGLYCQQRYSGASGPGRTDGAAQKQAHSPGAASSIRVEVSGMDDPIEITLWPGEASARMPVPTRISTMAIPGLGKFPAVWFSGIVHVIMPEQPKNAAMADAVIDYLRMNPDIPAGGAMFLERLPDEIRDKNGKTSFHGELIPYVWVRGPESRVWESSCASGTIAASCWLAIHGCRTAQTASFLPSYLSSSHFTFHEPGGTLTATVNTAEGTVISAAIGGPVSLETRVKRTYSVPDPDNS